MNRNNLINRLIEYINVSGGDTNVHNVFVNNNNIGEKFWFWIRSIATK